MIHHNYEETFDFILVIKISNSNFGTWNKSKNTSNMK
jgi:hypothetical protein